MVVWAAGKFKKFAFTLWRFRLLINLLFSSNHISGGLDRHYIY
jgi:hypothetical protein